MTTHTCDCRIIWNAASQQQIARCSLHAAAPEMLEALEALATAYPEGPHGIKITTMARAAIAKARGEQS